MATPPRSRETLERAVKAVEDALRKGYKPPSVHLRGGESGAIATAATHLGVNRKSFVDVIADATRQGIIPDWTLYKAPACPTGDLGENSAHLREAKPDPIAERRDSDRLADLRARLAAAERVASDAQEFRASILGLTSTPLRPAIVVETTKGKTKGGRTIVAHLSDVHYGERVDLLEMDGVNAYNKIIAKTRLGRYFGKVVALAVDHWHGPPPDEIVLCLGGDLISGMIHGELVETNDASTPRAVRDLAEIIAGGIALLRAKVKCPVRVISVPGNHARLTVKPQSKRRAAHNLDLLVADFAEAALRGPSAKNVRFFATDSPDAYFSVYGWNFCLTHGDAMGVGGGKGYIGPIAPITKGHRLLFDGAAKTRRRIHYVMTAHYHTTARTPFGWGNGSVVGYGEYARDLRADPEPAKQNLLVVHRDLGVIQHNELYLGAPNEGRLYEGSL